MSFANLLFKVRSYTPVPFVIVALILAEFKPVGIAIGFVSGILGEWLRITANKYAGGATRTRNVGAPSLVKSGPYGCVRNPLYLANMMIYTGFAIASGALLPWLPIVIFVCFAFQYGIIIWLEEKSLLELFGEEYRQYCRSVPRFLPKLKSCTKECKADRTFSDALHLEKRSLQGIFIVWLLLVFRLTVV